MGENSLYTASFQGMLRFFAQIHHSRSGPFYGGEVKGHWNYPMSATSSRNAPRPEVTRKVPSLDTCSRSTTNITSPGGWTQLVLSISELGQTQFYSRPSNIASFLVAPSV